MFQMLYLSYQAQHQDQYHDQHQQDLFVPYFRNALLFTRVIYAGIWMYVDLLDGKINILIVQFYIVSSSKQISSSG